MTNCDETYILSKYEKRNTMKIKVIFTKNSNKFYKIKKSFLKETTNKKKI